MILRHGIYAQEVQGGGIVTDGLVLNMESFNPLSYNNVGTVITDVSVLGNPNDLTKSVNFNNNTKLFEYNGGTNLISRNNSFTNEDWDINKTGEISIEFWVNYDQLVRSLDGSISYGLAYGNRTAGHYQWQFFKHYSGSNFRLGFYVTSLSQYISIEFLNNSAFNPIIPFTANKFFQFVFSYKMSTQEIKGYMNGYDAGGTFSGSLTNPPQTPVASYRKLQIGGTSGYSRSMLGDLGVFRIYNKSLLPSEVLKNYEANKIIFGY